MKNGNIQAKECFTSCSVKGLIGASLLTFVWTAGCARFNEYVAPPTIVDASTHAPSDKPAYQPVSNQPVRAVSQPEQLEAYSGAASPTRQNPYARATQGEPARQGVYPPPPPYVTGQGAAPPAVAGQSPCWYHGLVLCRGRSRLAARLFDGPGGMHRRGWRLGRCAGPLWKNTAATYETEN